MKGQDIGLLLKLDSLQEQEDQARQSGNNNEASYTARALEQETGISKSQVNLSINRCYQVGLLKKDRHLGSLQVMWKMTLMLNVDSYTITT